MIFLLESAKEVESVTVAARDTSYGLIARVSSNRLKVPRLLMFYSSCVLVLPPIPRSPGHSAVHMGVCVYA